MTKNNMTKKNYLDFFKPYAEAFWLNTLERLHIEYETFKTCEHYEGETFVETLDREFWSMGCDYLDFTNEWVDDFFYKVIDEEEYDELKEKFDNLDAEFYDLRSFIFETYAMPKIKEIIMKGE